MVTIGQRIFELRKRNKWTQEVLARQLGLDRTTISKWERAGGSEPDTETIKRLSDLFDVDTDYLLGRTNIPNPNNLPHTVATHLPEGFDELTPEAQKEVLNFIEFVRSKYGKKKGDKS